MKRVFYLNPLSANAKAVADELYACVWPFCGADIKGLWFSTTDIFNSQLNIYDGTFFVTVKDLQLLFIFAKRSVLDVWLGFEYTSGLGVKYTSASLTITRKGRYKVFHVIVQHVNNLMKQAYHSCYLRPLQKTLRKKFVKGSITL